MNKAGKDQVQLWVASEQELLEAPLKERYIALLNEAERTRWQRFRQAADRNCFLQARALVRTVLGALLNRNPAELDFTQTEHGKPELAAVNGALPLHFNLSHTRGLLALAVCRTQAVGVDVEAVQRKVELLALSQRYFATHEHEELLELEGSAQRERFFALWTLKEAWLKARGLGLRIPLDDFSFSFAGKYPEIQFGPQLDEKPQDWQLRLIAHGRFRIALAVQCTGSQALQVQMHQWPGTD